MRKRLAQIGLSLMFAQSSLAATSVQAIASQPVDCNRAYNSHVTSIQNTTVFEDETQVSMQLLVAYLNCREGHQTFLKIPVSEDRIVTVRESNWRNRRVDAETSTQKFELNGGDLANISLKFDKKSLFVNSPKTEYKLILDVDRLRHESGLFYMTFEQGASPEAPVTVRLIPGS